MTAARIETDEGAWQQHPQSMLNFDCPIGHTVDRAFVGEGGYEGLIAFVKDSAIAGNRLQFDGVVITDKTPRAGRAGPGRLLRAILSMASDTVP